MSESSKLVEFKLTKESVIKILYGPDKPREWLNFAFFPPFMPTFFSYVWHLFNVFNVFTFFKNLNCLYPLDKQGMMKFLGFKNTYCIISIKYES